MGTREAMTATPPPPPIKLRRRPTRKKRKRARKIEGKRTEIKIGRKIVKIVRPDGTRRTEKSRNVRTEEAKRSRKRKEKKKKRKAEAAASANSISRTCW